jgi:hypothetical protein
LPLILLQSLQPAKSVTIEGFVDLIESAFAIVVVESKLGAKIKARLRMEKTKDKLKTQTDRYLYQLVCILLGFLNLDGVLFL